jgi:hypothetical protein
MLVLGARPQGSPMRCAAPSCSGQPVRGKRLNELGYRDRLFPYGDVHMTMSALFTPEDFSGAHAAAQLVWLRRQRAA